MPLVRSTAASPRVAAAIGDRPAVGHGRWMAGWWRSVAADLERSIDLQQCRDLAHVERVIDAGTEIEQAADALPGGAGGFLQPGIQAPELYQARNRGTVENQRAMQSRFFLPP
jgi:hypothetical protein